MNELDFDELDRAVSSLMDKATTKPGDTPVAQATIPQAELSGASSQATTSDDTQSDNAETQHATVEDGHHDENDVKPSETEDTAQEETVVTPDADSSNSDDADAKQESTPQASDETKRKVIPHRTGRFMDMKTSSAAPSQPAKMPSRVGATLNPVEDSVSTGAPVAEDKPTPTPEESDGARSDFPDPIDMMSSIGSSSQDETPSVVEDPEVPEAPVVTETPEETKEPEVESKPAESEKSDFTPFLADAKPEKRPLGSPLSAESTSEPAATLDIEKPTDPMSDLPDGSLAVPAPPEFDNELMAIESGDVEKETSGEATTPTPDSKENELPKPASIETAPVKPTGPVSIPQQYDEQPNSGPGDNGAIFDTATYHQPLEHPAKKSNGLMWIILIVITILLGAAAGAAFIYGYL